MNINKTILSLFLLAMLMYMCKNKEMKHTESTEFQWELEEFADVRILRYQIPGFEKLSPQQKELVYYLAEAGMAGRDIIYDQNHRYNLAIKEVLQHIHLNYKGDKENASWQAFDLWSKRFWFSNGNHHHYSHQKFDLGFSRNYLEKLMQESKTSLEEEVLEYLFDPKIDAKKVSKDDAEGQDLLLQSAVNFYGPDVNTEEAQGFYQHMRKSGEVNPPSYGLNSRLIKENGILKEETYKLGAKYSAAIEKIIFWLKKAEKVAENEAQAKALRLLITYYETGDLKIWDEYNIAWVQATEGDVDYINSFIEVYNDPIGYKANFESIVQITDFEASQRMKTLSEHIAWFEKNSPIQEEYKKPNVKGVTYKVVNVASEAGDASPATPIGVNLPNADWIRAQHGSKSVSLGNIEHAYDMASPKGLLDEFCFTTAEKERAEKWGATASKLHTALHEVVGHASGRAKEGVSNAKEKLANFYSTIEEARADLVALYYIMHPELISFNLMEDLEVGRAEYDAYFRNGLMLQLRRITPGDQLEEDHMRNRQLIALWAYELGEQKRAVERKVVKGKTYFVINDYEALQKIFGEMLREIQRIKSEGDYKAAKLLVEKYGIKVEGELHAEVLKRSAPLKIPPYAGFVNPILKPVFEKEKIIDVVIEYPESFKEQMLYYHTNYSFLKP